jgi:hypothetical protein
MGSIYSHLRPEARFKLKETVTQYIFLDMSHGPQNYMPLK